MISDFNKERFTDKYSDWSGALAFDERTGKHYTDEELEEHLNSQWVKDECEYLGVTVEEYEEKFINK